LSITEITEYTYFGLICTLDEFRYESDYDIVPFVLIIGPIPFLWNTFYYMSAVRGQSECDFSILGRIYVHRISVVFIGS